MKLFSILEKYDTVFLDRIAADKVDDSIGLRLPQTVIVQEIISALSSQSYIAGKIQYARPPVFAFLNLILESPDGMRSIDGFRDLVAAHLNEISAQAAALNITQHPGRQLYVKILKRAWESDGFIDKNEAYILELIKQELGIWDREHYILMHDPSILSIWDAEQEYYSARNYLLTTGIILACEGNYVIADEVAAQLQKTLGIEMTKEPFQRMFDGFFREDLATILNYFQLNISGTKDVMIERLYNSLVPPFELLSTLSLEVLKDICRHNSISGSGVKSNVIQNIIDHYNHQIDQLADEPEPADDEISILPETREMTEDMFSKMLSLLTGQQLYDILYHCYLATSGSKEEKIKRIVESRYSERKIFHHLRKEDLSQICRKLALPVSGSKQELTDRIIEFSPAEQTSRTEIEQVPLLNIPDTEELRDGRVEALRSPEESTPPPPGYEKLKEEFPELDHGELTVLAILKDVKSFTEQELERIVAKYQLGWFLHKAQMAEIIAKLQRQNKHWIKIKSVQNTNIYQWAAGENVDAAQTERKVARDIIDALRHGVVPKNNLETLMVGQQSARKHLSAIVMEVGAQKSHFKFIRGQYGSGKTFLCSWLKEFAFKNEFVVSFINIGHDQPLSDLPVFYAGLINGLRTPEKNDSSALLDILESWLLNIHNRVARLESVEGVHQNTPALLKEAVERSIQSQLAGLNDIEPGFSQAVRAFYQGKIEGNSEMSSHALAWITGSRSLSAQSLRAIGVKGYLEPHTVFQRVRALLEIIGGARYRGLLLLIDELELVRKFPHARQREQAFETLRLLIDEVGRNALPGCCIIFTGTDEFFEDERYGMKSYEALSERIITPLLHESFVSMRQPIISLEALDSERLGQVLLKIRDLYGIAYNWAAHEFASDEAIGKLVEEWTVFGNENIERKPRPILREFIQMLDLCEENKEVQLTDFIKRSKE